MKISYDWLKDYLPVDIPPGDLSEILTSLGLEVSSVETIESIRGGLHGVVAGKVVECGKHPNADRLSLCRVDIGTETSLSIVCGAPNVAEGQIVWVAQVGSCLYPSGSMEPMEIKKAKVRGEHSEGMICAEDELGLGSDHSGIMILPDTITPGTPARQHYEISEDVVFDIDLTPNRSDATSHLGVAEDVKAYLQINGDAPVEVTWPEIKFVPPETVNSSFEVEVENTDGCPRYAGVLIDDIQVGESPGWMQKRLKAVGVRPINNIVDITNYVLHEMGQPMHAFDADNIGKGKIVVKTLPDGSKFTSLDEIERTLTETDLMICDGSGKGLCIAGVFGGIGSGVTEKTQRVFLESAHFDPEWVRKTSMHHLLRTDAARTFEKSTDPNVCVKALNRVAALVLEHAGGRVASQIFDIYPNPLRPVEVSIRWKRINTLIGVALSKDTVRDILKALSMDVVSEDDDVIVVQIPTNKADVTREADVIEEILRIYGFNNVPMKSRMEVALTWMDQVSPDMLRYTLGSFLSSLGFLEIMGLSLTEEVNFADGPLAIPADQQVFIENTSNISLNLMRPDLLVTAMETVQYNQNRRQEDLRLYEFGNSYVHEGEKMIETEHLTLIISGAEVPNNWRNHRDGDADYYVLKKYVESVLSRVGLGRYQSTRLDDDRFAYGMKYHLGKDEVVSFGLISEGLRDQFGIRKDVMFADFRLTQLVKSMGRQSLVVKEVSRFPGVIRDLSIDLPRSVEYAELIRQIQKTGGDQLKHVGLFDVYESTEHLGADRKSYAVQLTYENQDRTMTDSEIDDSIKEMMAAIGVKLDGKLR